MKTRDEQNIEEGAAVESTNQQASEAVKERPAETKRTRNSDHKATSHKPAPMHPVQTEEDSASRSSYSRPTIAPGQMEQVHGSATQEYRERDAEDMDDASHGSGMRKETDDRYRSNNNRGWDSQGQQGRPHHSSGGSNNQNYRARNKNAPAQRQQPDQKFSALKLYEQKQIPIEELSLQELNMYSRRLGIIGATLLTKSELIQKIKYAEAHPDTEMKVEGVLEKLPDGFGFLRSSQFDYVSGPDDVYVSPSQIRRFNLKTGDMITGVLRKPKEGEKYFALLKVDTVNYDDPLKAGDRMSFERLTPLHPDKKFNLEIENDPKAIATRIMDIFTPIGKGQRGLIVAPPKVGKTVLLKEIVKSLIVNHPEAHLIVLLIDERPEEVTDMKKAVLGSAAEVISSTFDESAERHVQVAELVLEKAKRLVEAGRDVVILLDAITRLARAYNTVAPTSGKVLTGGIDANALQRPKRFFGAARNTQEGGSLTIIATALVDTGSRMDEVIYEEFKGTGNMEMHMNRKLSNRRVYPAFDLMMSGTRRDDLLHDAEDLNKVWVLQKFLSSMNTSEGMEFLIEKIKKTKTNREFLDIMNKKADTGSGTSNGNGSHSA